MGSKGLFVIVLNEPDMIHKGLFAIVKAFTIEEAREKVEPLGNDVPAKLINHLDWEALGSIDDFEYVIYEYWE